MYPSWRIYLTVIRCSHPCMAALSDESFFEINEIQEPSFQVSVSGNISFIYNFGLNHPAALWLKDFLVCESECVYVDVSGSCYGWLEPLHVTSLICGCHQLSGVHFLSSMNSQSQLCFGRDRSASLSINEHSWHHQQWWKVTEYIYSSTVLEYLKLAF